MNQHELENAVVEIEHLMGIVTKQPMMALDLPPIDLPNGKRTFANEAEVLAFVASWTPQAQNRLALMGRVTSALERLTDLALVIGEQLERSKLFTEARSALRGMAPRSARTLYATAKVAEAVKEGLSLSPDDLPEEGK